jgi:hypothetical protein
LPGTDRQDRRALMLCIGILVNFDKTRDYGGGFRPYPDRGNLQVAD